MNSFTVPIHLRDLELPTSRYVVDEEVARAGAPASAAAQRAEVERVRKSLDARGAAAVVDEFDALYVLTRDAERLDDGARAALAVLICEDALGAAARGEALRPGATLEPADLDVGRRAFLMAAVLAQAVVGACDAVAAAAAETAPKAKKGKKKSDDDAGGGKNAWAGAARLRALEALGEALKAVDVAWLWNLRVVDEAALLLWVRAGGRALLAKKTAGNASHRAAARACVGAAVYGAPPDFGAPAAAALVEDLVLSGEAGAKDAAELCAAQADGRVAGAVLRELDRVAADGGGEAGSAKLVAAFVDHLGAKAPEMALQHVATLKAHLSSPHHGLRSAVVASLAGILATDAERRLAKADDDDDGAEPREALADEARDALLDLVVERARDASHWTRAATLRAARGLVEGRAVPRARYGEVAAVAASRLRDKTAQVRKDALKLLVAALEHNPFAPVLDPAPFEKRADALAAALVAGDAADALRDRARAEAVLARAAAEDAGEEAPPSEEVDEAAEEARAGQRQKVLTELEYHAGALGLVRTFEGAAAQVDRLARSATASDAVGAAAFFGVARAFDLPCGRAGLRAVLRLACSDHDAVKTEAARVVAASLEVAPGARGAAAVADAGRAAAGRACALVAGCSATDLQCLEALVAAAEKACAAGKGVRVATPKLVRALWDVAASRDAAGDRTAACRFLAVAAAAVGGGVVDAEALGAACGAVVADDAVDCGLADALARLVREAARGATGPQKASLVGPCATLRAALFEDLEKPRHAGGHWYGAADAVLAATFSLEDAPEDVAGDCLTALCGAAGLGDAPGETLEAEAGAVARCLHAAGSCALLLLTAAEDLGTQLKKRAAVPAAPAPKDGDDDDLAAQAGGGAEGADAEREARLLRLVERDIVGDRARSTGLVACLAPLAAKVASRALARKGAVPPVLHRSATLCLAKMACVSRGVCEEHLPLLVTTLARAPDAAARTNVAVALGDLAARQPNSVEPWTDHVYGALRDADPDVRAAVLATLAHLALNDMIKARGGGVAEVALLVVDADDRIRRRARAFFDELHKKSTATTSPIYNLLPDVVSRLSAARRAPVAAPAAPVPAAEEPAKPADAKKRLRFSVAPDAGLGDAAAEAAAEAEAEDAPAPEAPEAAAPLSAESFQTILGFLLAFVDKEKHAEALAEKLCQRLDATKADDDGVLAAARAKPGGVDGQAAARRDLAFCLGKLLLTEKVARKIAEMIGSYKDALPDGAVHETFLGIVAKARKLPKAAELKDFLDGWEAQLVAGHERRLDLDGTNPAGAPASAKKAPRKRAAPKKKGKATKKKVVLSESDDDDSDGGAAGKENARAAAPRPQRARRGVRA